jgi:hypothetical protein
MLCPPVTLSPRLDTPGKAKNALDRPLSNAKILLVFIQEIPFPDPKEADKIRV